VELDGDSHSYRSICLNVAFSTHCRPDAFLTLVELWNRTWIHNFTYPLLNITIGPLRRSQNIGPLLGGVELNEQGEIGYVRFVRLIFNMPPTISAGVLDKYEKAWTDSVNAFISPIIQVQSWSSRQYDRDMRQIGVRTMRLDRADRLSKPPPFSLQTRSTVVSGDRGVFGEFFGDARPRFEQAVAGVERRRVGRTGHRDGTRSAIHRGRSSDPDRHDYSISRTL
jgi:hypothetical protein